MSLLEKIAALLPPDRPLEVKPGYVALGGGVLTLKMRVYRAATGQWEDVPDEVSDVNGVPK